MRFVGPVLALLIGLLVTPALGQIEYNVPWVRHGVAFTPVTQVFIGGENSALPTTAVTRYSFPLVFSNAVWQTTEPPTEAIVLAGTISELRVQLSQSVGTGPDAARYRIRHCDPTCAPAADDVECQVVSGSSNCTDLVSSFAVATGDRLTLQLITSGTPAAGTKSFWSFKWVGAASNESMLAMIGYMDGGSVTECPYAGNPGFLSTSCGLSQDISLPAASDFNITQLWARNQTELGATCQRVTLFKNGSADSTFQVDLTGAVGNQSDLTGGPVSFLTSSIPDHATVQIDPAATTCGSTGAATNSYISFTLGLTNTSQHFMTGGCIGAGPSTSATNYNAPTGGLGWNATESLVDAIVDAFTQKGFAAQIDTAPGVGKSWAFSIMDDTAATFGCSIADTNSTCNGSGSSPIIAASLVDLRSIPTGTPTGFADMCWALSGTGG